MAIVATEIESIHGAANQKRLIFYKCQDHLGVWHNYGPVYAEPGFNIDAHKTIVAAKMTESLANTEFELLIGDIR